MSVLLGQPGGFVPATDYLAGYGPYGIAAGDFNLDGRLGLATSNIYGNSVSVLLGQPGGFAGPAQYPVDNYPFSLTAGDFNGDGRLDLASASYVSSTVSVLRNGGCWP